MWLDEVRPEDVRGRAATSRLLPHDPDGALAIARAIRHPWYRCQALTYVAEKAKSRNRSVELLHEAFAAPHEQSEPNRVVTVASWPLRHLVGIDQRAATREVETLLSLATSEPHPLRRLHALDAVLGAVSEEPQLLERVAETYLATAQLCFGWRADRTISFRAEAIAALDIGLAEQMLNSRKAYRFTNRARRVINSTTDGVHA